MSTKTSSLLIFFSLLTTQAAAISLDPTPYTEQANRWVSTYLKNSNNLVVPAEDFQFIANLCHFSLQRSINTLQAQKKAIEALAIVWGGWQNIAQHRLDPSKEMPHPITAKERTQALELFWQLHDAHQTIGATYTHAVNTIVHGDALTSAKATKSVQVLRDQARTIVAQALSDVRSYLGDLFYIPKGPKTTQATVDEVGNMMRKGFSLFDHLWSYIPQLAVYSFVKADELNNKVSEESWNTLKTIQDVGIRTWKAIEKARASFYLAHYKATLSAMVELDLDEQYKTVVFNVDGLVSPPKRKEILPKETL